MKFLVEPTESGGWVAAQDNLDEILSRELILACDVCFSDLDDTDTPSPAKKIAYDSLKSTMIFDPIFLGWCFIARYKLLREGKQAESEVWKYYMELFLRDSKKREKIRKRFTEENIPDLLYPGVQEFYEMLEVAKKFYITRNIIEVVKPFADFLGFDNVMVEVFDKERVISQIIERYPEFRRCLVKGDSEEDEGILDKLDFYKGKGRIEDVVSCYVADSPDNINEKFTFNIGRNYFGLVGIMQGNLNHNT